MPRRIPLLAVALIALAFATAPAWAAEVPPPEEPPPPADTAPVANDDAYRTAQDASLEVPAPGLLANDFDPDGDPVAIESVGEPDVGSIEISSDGHFIYWPPPGFVGVATWTYTARASGASSNSATVTVRVGVNDPPIVVGELYSVLSGNQLVVPAPGLLGNDFDPDGDTLTASLVTGPANGAAEVGAAGDVSYAPNPGFTGFDTLTYAVSDTAGNVAYATVNISVELPNNPPVAKDDSYNTEPGVRLDVPASMGVLANDSDPDGDRLWAPQASRPANGVLAFSGDGSFSYAPNPGFVGVDSFTYDVVDGRKGGFARAAVTITVGKRDTTPPTIKTPADVVVDATGPDGALVGYSVSAFDDVDGPVKVF